MMYRKTLITRLLLVFLVALLLSPVLKAEEVDKEIGSILKDINYLYEKGVNVDELIKKLNQALKLIEEGNKKKAENIISEVKEEITKLKLIADEVYLRKTIILYSELALILSIPILVYLLLPRIYLHLWYKYRREWVIKGVKK